MYVYIQTLNDIHKQGASLALNLVCMLWKHVTFLKFIHDFSSAQFQQSKLWLLFLKERKHLLCHNFASIGYCAWLGLQMQILCARKHTNGMYVCFCQSACLTSTCIGEVMVFPPTPPCKRPHQHTHTHTHTAVHIADMEAGDTPVRVCACVY